jgi:hypothetical protein
MAHGKKTGGRKPGSKNKRTLALEAEAAAASITAAADVNPRAVPALTKILKYFLDQAAAEAAKERGGNPTIIAEMLREARATAAQLAPFQSPRLSAVAVGQVTKMVVVVKGGLPPRNTSSLPAIAPPEAESAIAGPDGPGGATS